jgi:sterol desaturase/sphingolipid hydroxylase (fatty acid hydroxylase superfamily)
MNIFILDNEIVIRLGFFLGVFIIMASWERVAPRRTMTMPRVTRWFNNLLITFLNGVAVKIAFPITATMLALNFEKNEYGLLNIVEAGSLFGGLLAVVMLDLAIYAQHVAFHRVHIFWRLHRMHHTDMDIDVTTGARFHTLEILLSMAIKIGIVALIGAPAWSVLTFEILLNATSMFNHSNILINPRIDHILRLLLVTPDMHRVHHSVIIRETNSNYGFNFPCWDRLFGTYIDQPLRGHDAMTVGLANYRNRKFLTLPWMLVIPFLPRER